MHAVPEHEALARGVPHVSMTRDEALDLASELEEAYRAVSYSEQFYGLPALEEFHRRLCEAFDLHRQPL